MCLSARRCSRCPGAIRPPCPLVTAVVGEDIESDGRRSYLRVTLSEQDGDWIAHLTGTQSSGALLSMVLADGLLIVPEGMKTFRRAAVCRCACCVISAHTLVT